MTLDDLKTDVAYLENTIKVCQANIEHAKKRYLQDNAKFKIGNRVHCEGHWLYGPNDTGGWNKWIEGLFAVVDEAYIGHDLAIRYGIRLEPNQPYWKDHYRIFRDETSLTLVSQVTIS